jgi:hypothetical protein
MTSDGDLQVWLDTRHQAEQVLVVPCARSARAMNAAYELVVRKSAASGSSRITQQGKVELAPGQAQPLSQLTVDLRQGDDCRIEISLREGDVVAGRYAFDCGR